MQGRKREDGQQSDRQQTNRAIQPAQAQFAGAFAPAPAPTPVFPALTAFSFGAT
jgi:hypothetical protein